MTRNLQEIINRHTMLNYKFLHAFLRLFLLPPSLQSFFSNLFLSYFQLSLPLQYTSFPPLQLPSIPLTCPLFSSSLDILFFSSLALLTFLYLDLLPISSHFPSPSPASSLPSLQPPSLPLPLSSPISQPPPLRPLQLPSYPPPKLPPLPRSPMYTPSRLPCHYFQSILACYPLKRHPGRRCRL